MSDVLVAPQTSDPDLEQEEPKVAHIVRKDQQMEAYIEGTPITALCGTVFVPTRDPYQFPVCEPCIEAAKQIDAANRGDN